MPVSSCTISRLGCARPVSRKLRCRVEMPASVASASWLMCRASRHCRSMWPNAGTPPSGNPSNVFMASWLRRCRAAKVSAITSQVKRWPLHLVRLRDRTQRTIEPERTSQAAGTGRPARHPDPLLVHLVRLFGVDEDVAVAVAWRRLFERDALMPAVHAAHRIGLHGKRQVLMDADVSPPDARAVGIVAGERLRAVHLRHLVSCALAIDFHER